MSNLQSTTLSQIPSEVWSLMIAPVSKNTVSTMPIDEAKKFVIESYLIYSKRAAEIAEKDYKEALNNWKECQKTLKAHTKKMVREGWPSCVVSPGLSLQYDILQERKFKLNQIKLHCYKSYREAQKNADPFASIKLLAASYGREHKIKNPFEIAAWQRVWQTEGTIRNLEFTLYLREQELNESLIYLQESIKQVEHKNECLACAAITITQLQAKTEQLKKQIAENNKYCGTSKKLVLLTTKPERG